MATGAACFDGCCIPADNSVKRDRNSHVYNCILPSWIGNALQHNKYLIFYLHDVGELCKRIINYEGCYKAKLMKKLLNISKSHFEKDTVHFLPRI